MITQLFKTVFQGNRASITINGRKIDTGSGTNTVVIAGNGSGSSVTVNGVQVMTDDSAVISVTITGDCERIETVSGDVDVAGSAGQIKTVSGDVEVVGDLNGNVTTMSGDVTANHICGGVSTMSGDVRCRGGR